jgi:hypothetical protein
LWQTENFVADTPLAPISCRLSPFHWRKETLLVVVAAATSATAVATVTIIVLLVVTVFVGIATIRCQSSHIQKSSDSKDDDCWDQCLSTKLSVTGISRVFGYTALFPEATICGSARA